jgi:hypothetical protein
MSLERQPLINSEHLLLAVSFFPILPTKAGTGKKSLPPTTTKFPNFCLSPFFHPWKND